jgi:Heterodisulfide reductase, subunit C
LRKKLGLSEIPPTTHKYPEALKAIQDISKKMKFDKLVGFDWNTMNLEDREEK